MGLVCLSTPVIQVSSPAGSLQVPSPRTAPGRLAVPSDLTPGTAPADPSWEHRGGPRAGKGCGQKAAMLLLWITLLYEEPFQTH